MTSCMVLSDITSFTQSPPGILAPNTHVVFNCQANGSDVTWFVNGVRRDGTFSDYTISIEPITGFEHWNITLSIVASIDKNNTEIQCYANGRISGQVDREFGTIIVAGRYIFSSQITHNVGNSLCCTS